MKPKIIKEKTPQTKSNIKYNSLIDRNKKELDFYFFTTKQRIDKETSSEVDNLFVRECKLKRIVSKQIVKKFVYVENFEDCVNIVCLDEQDT